MILLKDVAAVEVAIITDSYDGAPLGYSTLAYRDVFDLYVFTHGPDV